jgi:pSer/pThr/pTyr-binding forkhead associated (FHA) protein
MLLLQFININKQPEKISGGTISIGLDTSNDVVIDEPGISDFHAEITIEESRIFLSDLLSENGTFVNNRRISRNKELHPWDRIKLASIEIEISEAEKYRPGDWALQKESDLLNSQYLPLQTLTYVGRDPDCNLVILDGLLSRKHTLLTIDGNRLLVEDLKSTNGTFINNIKIDKAYATPGDEITFDKITFKVLGPSPYSSASLIEDSTIMRDDIGEEATTLLNATDEEVFVSSSGNKQGTAALEETIIASLTNKHNTQLFENDEKTILLPISKNTEPPIKSSITNKYRYDWWWGISGFILSLFIGLAFYFFLR